MTLTEQERLVNAVCMAHARLRALLASVEAAGRRAQNGRPIVDDLRLVCADISLAMGWLEGEAAAVISAAPPPADAGAASGPIVH